MKIVADLHLHTLASQHAYSTLDHFIQQARTIGMDTIGIADHAPGMLDAPREYYFINMRVIPSDVEGVRVLKGVELNIMDDAGTVDLKSHILRRLDYAIASFHPGISPYYYSEKQYTKGYLGVLENPSVKILGHIDNPEVPADLEKVLIKAREKGVLIEINNASYGEIRPGSIDIARQVLDLAAGIGNHIIVSSDAHYHLQLGDYTKALDLIKDSGFPEDRVVNLDTHRFTEFFPRV